MATVELKGSEWRKFIKSEYSVIDCYGYNCVACVMLEPIYDAIADDLSGISFGRVNLSLYGEIGDEYGLDAMPTVLYFRNGKLIDKTIGSMERAELMQHISHLLYE